VSKNVAVFVDVANIFYAAKAAGVDIDYVTLLKSATAGRDFVRAYAYTGLDPENENQRQFHSFLARSGYKVVSKDIRKYGDGRIKANLDIELVVDMMRMAEKLDIAVVVSGDGDFAPAIYAVQQQGVRVEVISFRGNTSSDLIDAADVFIDISNIARVEKGARSGRRVAAEGDLSMTEVPDKESGVTPRRRRREGEERPDRPERPSRRRSSTPAPVADEDRPALAGLVALPGEKLSRGSGPVADIPVGAEPPPSLEEEGDFDAQPTEDGHRRRRRRGGRGRGRGGRGPGEATPPLPVEPSADTSDFPDEVPTLPQHSGFGSVWDRQIGMPSDRPAPPPVPREASVDDELEPEPDIPEYLIAERRQQDRRRDGRGGRGGRGGGYRSALDRERYGVGSRPGFSRGPGRGGKGGGYQAPSPGRASANAMAPIEQTPGGDPWSEVPLEVQELLRAELARRQAGAAPTAAPAREPRTPSTREPRTPPARERTAPPTREPADTASREAVTVEEGEAESRPTTRRRTRRPAATAAAEPEPSPAGAAAVAEEPKPKRTTRKRVTTTADAEPGATTEEPKPKRTPRKRTPKADTADEA
jgi:uncharacterized LabA/DUF88 family protein